VTFHVSTTEGTAEEYNMADSFTFGPSGRGAFSMRFSYHEIQFLTIEGLDKAPALSDVVGYRIASNLTRTGSFSCSSPLLTKMYDTTVNNYIGLTTGAHTTPLGPSLGSHRLFTPPFTGGMTVDCPHRERRGYGGDGHTSYEFALANFGVGSYFTKWARDFADVQGSDGNVPHTAPTVGGGGGPAWSGFVVTMPWEVQAPR